jgi:hypothetical protein
MNIFDSVSPEQIKYLLSMGKQQGLEQEPQGRPTMWEPNLTPNAAPVAPQVPEPPAIDRPGNVSGFANYGMQAPALQDPMAQIRGIMALAGDPNINRKEDPFQQLPEGGLMAYLRSLGV